MMTTFDASAWIRRFLDLGGSILITKNGPQINYPPEEIIIEYVMAVEREQWAEIARHAVLA